MDIELDNIKLMFGDCLERMKEIPDGSVDLILTDPPYGTMSGIASTEGVKNGLKGKCEWDLRLDLKKMMNECYRILRDRGVMILFSQGDYTIELCNGNHGNMPLSYRMIWVKDHFGNALISKKAPVNLFEDICVYSKREENLKDHPLQHWFNYELSDSEYNVNDLIKLLGSGGVRHHFTKGKVFRVPSEDRYNKIRDITGKFDLDYSQVSEINEQYLNGNAKVDRTFNLPEGKKTKPNVLIYPKDKDSLHPTQKPVDLLCDLISTFSNEGDVILDFTMGSGSTGVASIKSGRSFIGVELDPHYYSVACERLLTSLS